MKLLKACIALAAFAAIFVVPSIASATSPTLFQTTGGPGNGTEGTSNDLVPVGTLIQAFNVEHSTTPTQTVMTTGVGNVVCGTATLTGTLTKNGGGIEGNITTAEFAGTHGVTTTGHCQGTGVLGEKVTVTPSHTVSTGLPWCVKVKGGDEFEVRGSECAKEATPLVFTLHGSLTCSYEKASVLGTYTTHPSDALATINKQGFKRTAGSSIFCPAEGSLDMAFTITTDTGKAKHSEEVALNIT